ncbi:hypothetical protein EJ110_NYTH20322 [Nymphaea thermarum]|nr:hypothetical protein EJ110_NYTH20322 [Nymphaea thermarum]
MHAKSDSEVTSLAASSPTRSPPRRLLYYVQSPSQHDGEKMSFQSSPAGSPPHPHYYGVPSPVHHSRESSTTRFSGSLKKDASSHHHHPHGRRQPWPQYAHVDEHGEEEEGEDGDGRESGIPARCYFLLFVVCFLVLFTFFSLILWGASRSYEPVIAVKSMTFWRFNVQAGMDASGVATQMLTINATVKLSFTNRATFFGCHFTSSPLRLHYMDLRLASGDIEEFYQPRKSTRLISTVVQGIQVPLYGAGSSLSSEPTMDSPSVPLTLTFMTRSRAFILGKLVKTKFYIDIKCAMELNQKNTGKPVNLKGACSYT